MCILCVLLYRIVFSFSSIDSHLFRTNNAKKSIQTKIDQNIISKEHIINDPVIPVCHFCLLHWHQTLPSFCFPSSYFCIMLSFHTHKMWSVLNPFLLRVFFSLNQHGCAGRLWPKRCHWIHQNHCCQVSKFPSFWHNLTENCWNHMQHCVSLKDLVLVYTSDGKVEWWIHVLANRVVFISHFPEMLKFVCSSCITVSISRVRLYQVSSGHILSHKSDYTSQISANTIWTKDDGQQSQTVVAGLCLVLCCAGSWTFIGSSWVHVQSNSG